MPAKGDGRLTSSEFADAMRGGDTKKGKKAASRLNTVGLRSDLVLEGKESLGAFGGKSRSLLNIDGKGKVHFVLAYCSPRGRLAFLAA